ncbi:MAG: type II toxin-antitoxin system VapC family toxin [Anaerolineae bacterium]|nr:type II toxin-antitoxin system VapC family toxin [Anaerolineae bacterium]
MLIDSNIIIYAVHPEHAHLRRWIAENTPFVSAVSYIEVLGYHQLTEAERHHFTAFFEAASVLPLSQEVLEQAVKLRQLKKMTLGDALIAGTALVYNLTLVTRNVADFTWIAGLTVFNPFETQVS